MYLSTLPMVMLRMEIGMLALFNPKKIVMALNNKIRK